MRPEISSLYFCFRLDAEFISHHVSYSGNYGHILLQSKTPIILKIEYRTIPYLSGIISFPHKI